MTFGMNGSNVTRTNVVSYWYHFAMKGISTTDALAATTTLSLLFKDSLSSPGRHITLAAYFIYYLVHQLLMNEPPTISYPYQQGHKHITLIRN